MNPKRIHSYLFLIYIASLILLTVIPLNTVQGGSSINEHEMLNVRGDYWLHALVYLPLPLLMGAATKDRPKGTYETTKIYWPKMIFYSIILAAGLEIFQLLLQYRTFNINDLAGNIGGVMVGFLLVLAFNINRNSIDTLSISRRNVSKKK